MDTKSLNIYIVSLVFCSLLVAQCKKKKVCPKEGYEYLSSTSVCTYTPLKDSIQIGDSIVLTASLPRKFLSETTNTLVNNSSSTAEGPIHIVMLYPQLQGGADNFKMDALAGNIFKDSVHFSQGQLKEFRTIRWDGSAPDSFYLKVVIKPQTRGIFSFALGQQSSKDPDCALYKYFSRVGHEQHLYYLAQYNNGYISDYEKKFAYNFKVY